MSVNVTQTQIPGLVLVKPRQFPDARGFFVETWNKAALAAQGIYADFVQDNHSYSRDPGTLRGLHFQSPPRAQAKLVRCSRGAIWDVAVDVRAGSPSYGHWQGFELTPENGLQLFIPAGFLHGFVTTAPDTEVQYKCTDFYAPDCDGSVLWDSVGIDWAQSGHGLDAPILSDKDRRAVPFADFETPFVFAG